MSWAVLMHLVFITGEDTELLPTEDDVITWGIFKGDSRGSWVAQSLKPPTLGFGSGGDLRAMTLGLSGSMLSMEST